MNAAPLQLQRDVSSEPDEFRRGVELAFPGQVRDEEEQLIVSDGNTRLEITMIVGPPRTIGAFRLPTLRVSLRFSSGTTAEQQRMLAALDRAMHRGGG